MTQLVNLSDASDQLISVVLDDRSVLGLELIYRPGISRWVFSVTHTQLVTAANPNRTVNGLILSVHPNLMRQYKNLVTFGLTCTSADGADPYAIEDFTSNRVQLYVLNATDIAYVEATIFQVAA